VPAEPQRPSTPAESKPSLVIAESAQSLHQVAKLIGVDVNKLHMANAGTIPSAYDPVPVGKQVRLPKDLLKESTLAQWAARLKIPVDALLTANTHFAAADDAVRPFHWVYLPPAMVHPVEPKLDAASDKTSEAPSDDDEAVCPHCSRPHENMQMHVAQCDLRPHRCHLCGESYSIKYEALHMSSCKNRPVPCPTCGAKLANATTPCKAPCSHCAIPQLCAQAKGHAATCDLRPVKCPKCSAEVTAKGLEAHLSACIVKFPATFGSPAAAATPDEKPSTPINFTASGAVQGAPLLTSPRVKDGLERQPSVASLSGSVSRPSRDPALNKLQQELAALEAEESAATMAKQESSVRVETPDVKE